MSKMPENLLEGLSQLASARQRPMSVVALQSQVTFEPDGQVNMSSIVTASHAAGLSLLRHQGPLNKLPPENLPALAACGDGSYKLVSDPDQTLAEDLPGGYAGHCLLLLPRPGPDLRSELPARRNARAWFWKVLWSLKPFYAHVAIATLVVNLPVSYTHLTLPTSLRVAYTVYP